MATLSAQSIKAYIDNVKYFTCPRGGLHEGEALNRICNDKECAQKGLVCVICEEESHKSHETIPVKQFLKILVGENNSRFQNSIDSLLTIQRLKQSTQKIIALKKRQIELEFQKLENEATRYFNEVEQMAKNLLHAEGPIQKIVEDMIYGNEDNLPELTRRINEVLFITGISNDNEFSIKNSLKYIASHVNEKYQKTTLSLNTLMTDMNKSIQNLSKMLQENISIPDSGDYIWSPTMKGAKINIVGAIAEQTGMESSGQRFILMNKNLNSNSRKKSWGIKIKKFGGWIGIGMSLKKQIMTANYNFHYTILGHGSYLISTNGYSWSHSEKEFNSAFKCFTFAVGDTVFMEYNPFTKKLKFRKNESKDAKDTFELDVVTPPGDDAYYPCANLCGTNDSVEIVPCLKSLS